MKAQFERLSFIQYVEERNDAMSDANSNELDPKEAEFLVSEVTDEALERAAGIGDAKAGAWTLGACTGISVCPG
jgi:hypothetical protein